MAMCLYWPAAGTQGGICSGHSYWLTAAIVCQVASLGTVRSLLLLLVRKVPPGWGTGRRPVSLEISGRG